MMDNSGFPSREFWEDLIQEYKSISFTGKFDSEPRTAVNDLHNGEIVDRITYPEKTKGAVDMENVQNDVILSDDRNIKENLRVQKTEYIKQQLARQREAEDQRMSRLMQEQEVINALRESIDESRWETEEIRKYNKEFQENVNAQIYEAYGISGDKLTGMREYKNAIYRGVAVVIFLLSAALTVLCGVVHGFSSEITLVMAAFTAMEGALLSQEKKQLPVLFVICRVMYILALPAMAVIFVCFELGFPLYGMLLPYAPMFALAVTTLGVLSYFLYDPFHADRKLLRDAKKQIRRIEKLAKKEVKKTQQEPSAPAEPIAVSPPEESVPTEPAAVSLSELPVPAEPIVLTLTPEPEQPAEAQEELAAVE